LPKVQEETEQADDAAGTKSQARRRTTREKSRGRQETRHYTILPLPESRASVGAKWKGLTSIGRVVREVTYGEKVTNETSYYSN